MITTDERIDLINNARDQSFKRPIFEDFTFQRVSTQDFWDVYAHDFHAHVPSEVFFDEEKLRSNKENDTLDLLNHLTMSTLIEDNYLLVNADNKPVAMVRGWQKNFDSYYMQFTAVHSDYRKKGLYSAIIDRVLAYTKMLGFSRVLSCHAPFNNAVLIAKLKKDFKVIGMDVDAALGINVWLCYFHNEELKKAFEFRCGNIIFSQKLHAASFGTAEKLGDAITRC